jgi:hypothetical protein
MSFSFETVNVESGKTLNSVADLQVTSGCSVPDGRVFMVISGSGFRHSVWEAKTDLKSGVFTGKRRQILELAHTEDLSVDATAAGDKLLLLRSREEADTYVAGLEESGPRLTNIRRATFTGSENYPHAWTPGNKGIILESLRDTYDLYIQPLDQQTPELLVATPEHDGMAQMAPNGDYVLFAAIPNLQDRTTSRLARVRLGGGRAETVPIGGPLDEFRCAKEPGKRCVLRRTYGRDWYAFYDLDPIAGKGRELARTAWTDSRTGDWDLSMDGSTVAIPEHGGETARVRLVGLDKAGERELAIPGLRNLKGVVWSSVGSGLFAAVDARPFGTEFYRVDLNGGSRLLHRTISASWPVPTPDGRLLAFVDRTRDRNAWLVQWR